MRRLSYVKRTGMGQVYIRLVALPRALLASHYSQFAIHSHRGQITEFRKKCRSFLVTVAEQIKMRLDFGDPTLSRLGANLRSG